MSEDRRLSKGALGEALERREIASLYLEGSTAREIAATQGVSLQRVRSLLKKQQEYWLQASLVDWGKARARELARLDRLEREYWDGWKASKQVKTKTRFNTTTNEGDTEAIQTSAGNPVFLKGILTCIERRSQILGLDAPKQMAVHKFDHNADLKSLSTEELERIARGEEAAVIEGQFDVLEE